MNNHPFILKTHTYCTFEQVVEIAGYFRVKRCNAPTDKCAFCTEHAHAQHLLDVAAEHDYPELLPRGDEDGLIIRRGVASWETYCERVSVEHAKVMVHRLMKIKPVRKGVA